MTQGIDKIGVDGDGGFETLARRGQLATEGIDPAQAVLRRREAGRYAHRFFHQRQGFLPLAGAHQHEAQGVAYEDVAGRHLQGDAQI